MFLSFVRHETFSIIYIFFLYSSQNPQIDEIEKENNFSHIKGMHKSKTHPIFGELSVEWIQRK